ncbi:glycosyltransferase involved in cell wall biosynthesis [Bradyrhizobium sp. USDA 3397]
MPVNRFEHAPDTMILNLFYEDKDDRWFPGDRHLRRIARRLLLGEPRMSGQLRVFLNLCAGLDRLGIRYRVNDYGYIAEHPDELACVVGRTFLLDKFPWKNPILLGAAAHNHPLDDPDLFKRLPVKKVVVPGPWYVDMYRPYWPETEAWPVGIDTSLWAPSARAQKTIDVLIYDKVHWDRERYAPEMIEPVRARLIKEGRSFTELRYGSYKEADYQAALARSRAMIFLCQSESQGIAYQQALSCGVPVFAWDPGGPWRDPDYYPHRVQFAPVRRCRIGTNAAASGSPTSPASRRAGTISGPGAALASSIRAATSWTISRWNKERCNITRSRGASCGSPWCRRPPQGPLTKPRKG